MRCCNFESTQQAKATTLEGHSLRGRRCSQGLLWMTAHLQFTSIEKRLLPAAKRPKQTFVLMVETATLSAVLSSEHLQFSRRQRMAASVGYIAAFKHISKRQVWAARVDGNVYDVTLFQRFGPSSVCSIQCRVRMAAMRRKRTLQSLTTGPYQSFTMIKAAAVQIPRTCHSKRSAALTARQ